MKQKKKDEIQLSEMDPIYRFYHWQPPGDETEMFRCWHIQPYPQMKGYECKARAKNPDLFEAAGCSRKCPRWKYYRKLHRKSVANDNIVRRAYKK